MILQMIRLLHYIRAGKLLVSKVGINYVGAALDIATEQAASFRIVQVLPIKWEILGMFSEHYSPVFCRLD